MVGIRNDELWAFYEQRPQFSKRIIQRAAIVEVALFLVSLFVGISAADDETLKVASPWEPKSLDPIVYQLSVDVSEPLLSVDSEGKLSPMLAQSWDVSEDGRTWTFHLREGVSFHDGTPFNAEAAKLSLERTFRRSAEYSSIKAFPGSQSQRLMSTPW